MTRVLVGVAALVAGLSGCSSPARYIERTGEGGVVAIPANTDAWPNQYRSEALALIEKHVGPSYEIVEEREVATGRTTFNNQQVNENAAVGSTTTRDVTEWRIAYRKRGAPGTPGGVVQTQYRSGGAQGVVNAGGIVPSVAPGPAVQHAGGIPAR